MNKIKEIREKAGLKQTELATLMGTTYQQVQKLEKRNSDTLTIGWLRKIARALKTTPSEIIGDSDISNGDDLPTEILAAMAMKGGALAVEHKLSGEALSRVLDAAIDDYEGGGIREAEALITKYAKYELRHKPKEN